MVPRRIYLQFAVALLLGLTVLAVAWIGEIPQENECRSHFARATRWIEDATATGVLHVDDQAAWVRSIISEIIVGSESFLNRCTNPAIPLSLQLKPLEELVRLASYCAPRGMYATTQVVDLDADGIDELILQSQTIACGESNGGLTIIFHQDRQTRQWRGTVVWPCSGDRCSWDHIFDQSPYPLVQALKVENSKEQFILVAGKEYWADASGEILTIWRWKDSYAEPALVLRLSNWCMQPIEWEVTEEGHIVIPNAGATYRCEEHPRRTYVLQGDKFVLVEQSQ